MKTKFFLPALSSCFFLLINFWVTPLAHGARLDIVVDHGVEKDAEDQGRAAVKGIIDFFQNTYGVALERDMRIKFSCDKLNYKKAIQNWYGMGESQANFHAQNSKGLQSRGTLIVNLGDLRGNFPQLFVLCHEMVHHYQGQISGDRHGYLRWFSEGMADAVAVHVLETVGVKDARRYKDSWQENLKKARNWPRLDKLHAPHEWFAAVYAYGPYVTYKTSALAVLTLVDWKGYRALFDYLRDLKTATPEAAFYQAFGTRLADFEKQFRPN
ncbi:MAG: hypothetical protein ACOZF2_15885 [Thermodesulfobacteriota bacterium]